MEEKELSKKASQESSKVTRNRANKLGEIRKL